MTIDLDFSNCKTKEDIEKVFDKAKPIFEAHKKQIREFLEEDD